MPQTVMLPLESVDTLQVTVVGLSPHPQIQNLTVSNYFQHCCTCWACQILPNSAAFFLCLRKLVACDIVGNTSCVIYSP